MTADAVAYSDRLREHPAVLKAVGAATPGLAEMLSTSTEPVTAEWDVADTGRPAIAPLLRLRDFAGEATAVFDPAELADAWRTEMRFSAVFRRLLRNRSNVLMSRFWATGDQ